MGNQPLSGDLPSHLIGRTNVPGPATGGYVTWAVTVDNLPNGEHPEFDFLAPADLRIMEISAGCETVTTTGVTVTVVNGSTSLVAAYTFTNAPVALTLVSSAARDMDDGDILHVNLTAATGAIIGVTVLITAFIKGHVYADSAND